MKKSIADKIEQYLKVLIESSGEGQIEIQRSELAETFRCVPSQVTYVISTRFTQEEGYVTESRRGGKGFVRITSSRYLIDTGVHVNRQQITAYVESLLNQNLIGAGEYTMLAYLVECASTSLPADQQSELLTVIKTALSKYIDSGAEG